MQRSTRNILGIAIAALTALLIFNASIAWRQTHRLYDQSDLVVHTVQVDGALAQLMLTVSNAETGQRGYLLTGQKRYLVPYDLAVQNVDGAIFEIKELTADNPRQKERIAHLAKTVRYKLAELEETIRLHDQSEEGKTAALELVKTDRGQQLMEELRDELDEMHDEEQSLLDQRQAANHQAFESARRSIWLSLAGGLIGLGGLMWLIRRHFRAITKAAADVFEQRELLRATLISIGDGVISTDSDGRVTFLNVVAQHLTGWSAHDAVGRDLPMVFRIVNEETRREVENPAARALREGRIMGLANHTILIAKDGREWPIDDSAAPIRNQQGKVCGAILVFREIQERKQQEAELRSQAAQLEESDRHKTEFLATLAHELRNPLAPISNALQLWPHAENNRQQMEQLRGTMERQVRQMIRLIDDLMDISRISQGKIQLRKQAVRVDTLVQGALEGVKPLIESLEHRVTVTLPDEPLWVDGDVARLTQVVGNLLHNAAKYTGRKGTIWLSATRAGDRATISVRDNGPGIPQHMLGQVFDMFRQVDATLDRSHGGLGIGLTLVRRIVEAHGGTVEARSDGPGAGAEFVVSLPAIPATVEEGAGAKGGSRIHQLSHLPKHRILVVDDIEASATTMAMLLRALGQQVDTRFDGMAALDWLGQHSADVTFLDISMPGMDGYEVARRIRANPRLDELVLVALTGYGQEEDRRAAFEAGFNHHLVKPISIDALEQLLEGVPGGAGAAGGNGNGEPAKSGDAEAAK